MQRKPHCYEPWLQNPLYSGALSGPSKNLAATKQKRNPNDKIEGRREDVIRVFFEDSIRIISGSGDYTVRRWNCDSSRGTVEIRDDGS
jgi:hypothetical protein